MVEVPLSFVTRTTPEHVALRIVTKKPEESNRFPIEIHFLLNEHIYIQSYYFLLASVVSA